MAEGKIEQLITQKRIFLKSSVKDYSAGGNDMLDDVETLFQEAKAEITNRLELASCLKEESETAWRKECISAFQEWLEKWFGKP
jgi:hypothetical protein